MKEDDFVMCYVCREKPGFITHNFNGAMKLGPHHTILVCDDCDCSVRAQAFKILEELKCPEPHIIKVGQPLGLYSHYIGIAIKVPKNAIGILPQDGKTLLISTPTGGKKDGRRRRKNVHSQKR